MGMATDHLVPSCLQERCLLDTPAGISVFALFCYNCFLHLSMDLKKKNRCHGWRFAMISSLYVLKVGPRMSQIVSLEVLKNTRQGRSRGSSHEQLESPPQSTDPARKSFLCNSWLQNAPSSQLWRGRPPLTTQSKWCASIQETLRVAW